MKKVNIGISKETHAKAKIISVLQGVTLNDYLAQAIEKAVDKDKGVLAKIKP
jgi:predicted HicB family RNase H-like nuclease